MDYKSEALILQSKELRETSCMVIAFTPQHGRIMLTAKGARKDPLRFHGALQSITLSFLLLRSSGAKGSYLIQQSEVINPFPGIKSDIVKLSAAFALLDFTKIITCIEQSNPVLFDALLESLDWLDREESLYADQAIFFYLCRAIEQLGVAPRLDQCIGCGRPFIRANGRIRLSIGSGGLLCRSCWKKGDPGPVFSLSGASLAHLTGLYKKALTDFRPIRYSLQQSKELYDFLDHYIRYHLQMNNTPSSFRMYRDFRKTFQPGGLK